MPASRSGFIALTACWIVLMAICVAIMVKSGVGYAHHRSGTCYVLFSDNITRIEWAFSPAGNVSLSCSQPDLCVSQWLGMHPEYICSLAGQNIGEEYVACRCWFDDRDAPSQIEFGSDESFEKLGLAFSGAGLFLILTLGGFGWLAYLTHWKMEEALALQRQQQEGTDLRIIRV